MLTWQRSQCDRLTEFRGVFLDICSTESGWPCAPCKGTLSLGPPRYTMTVWQAVQQQLQDDPEPDPELGTIEQWAREYYLRKGVTAVHNRDCDQVQHVAAYVESRLFRMLLLRHVGDQLSTRIVNQLWLLVLKNPH